MYTEPLGSLPGTRSRPWGRSHGSHFAASNLQVLSSSHPQLGEAVRRLLEVDYACVWREAEEEAPSSLRQVVPAEQPRAETRKPSIAAAVGQRRAGEARHADTAKPSADTGAGSTRTTPTRHHALPKPRGSAQRPPAHATSLRSPVFVALFAALVTLCSVGCVFVGYR